MTHTDYGDSETRPHWGDPEDWDFDNLFDVWVYIGEDEKLKQRWDSELTLWENDYKYGPDPPPPTYDKKYAKAAKATMTAVVILCLILFIWVFLI